MQETTVRIGVGFELPLELSSSTLLKALSSDERTRLYFESSEGRPEEKFSAQLIDHELGAGSVARLLSSASEEAWRDETDRLRLGEPLRQIVTVHRDAVHFKEEDLGQRVHPCLVRLQDLTPQEVIESIREGVRHFVSLGVSEKNLRVCSALSDWS
jgi:hypothetical protein